MTERESAAAKYAYDRQSIWSQTSDRLKARPTRQRTWRLVLTAVAAVLALAASQAKSVSTPTSVALAIVAAVAMAAVAYTRWRASPQQAKRWTQARSVSEALKTEVFLFLCSGGDYRLGDRATRLRAEVKRLEDYAIAIAPYTLGITARKRNLPAVTDVESYLAVRVRESQLAGYYLPKAAAMKRRVDRLKIVEVTLALVAAALAAAAIASASVAAWAAVATTAGGAVAAYIAAERFEFLWIEYSRTAVQLQRLLDLHESGDPTAPAGPDLAGACEEVISIQNEAWMAKWGEEADDSGGGTPGG
ncbi:MAG TPA: DUF4231 domain-containing protein [Trebonia sp.]|nr:DUF4231 domain-containing protein [Trebonia sp.]